MKNLAAIVLMLLASIPVAGCGVGDTPSRSDRYHAGPNSTSESDVKDWLCDTRPTDSIDYSDC